jgi:hypothetical protein
MSISCLSNVKLNALKVSKMLSLPVSSYLQIDLSFFDFSDWCRPCESLCDSYNLYGLTKTPANQKSISDFHLICKLSHDLIFFTDRRILETIITRLLYWWRSLYFWILHVNFIWNTLKKFFHVAMLLSIFLFLIFSNSKSWTHS